MTYNGSSWHCKPDQTNNRGTNKWNETPAFAICAVNSNAVFSEPSNFVMSVTPCLSFV